MSKFDNLKIHQFTYVRPNEPDLDCFYFDKNEYSEIPKPFDPIESAPLYQPNGFAIGTDYFDDETFPESLVNDIKFPSSKSYNLYLEESETPELDGFFRQMLVVSKLNFGIDKLDKQTLSIKDALSAFIDAEGERCGSGQLDIDGVLGGDGEFSYELLAFGFTVESSEQGIYRIWSRAWIERK